MKMSDAHTLMHRCLELAQQGNGRVSPNPMVGCVIVKGGKIVGEGYHKQFGGPHAEIYALLHAGSRARGASLVTNLEPCIHFGKTPPCCDAIIQSGIKKVIIGTRDPNPLMSGKGIRRLRSAGIAVEVGVLQREAKLLNEKFFRWMCSGIPFVGIKLATTLDGYIADVASNSQWITSERAREKGHRLRTEYDAIMVGATTIRTDDPELTVRWIRGRNPVRIVVDGALSLPVSRKIFHTHLAPTWVLTSSAAIRAESQKVFQLIDRGVRILNVSSSRFLKPKFILQALANEGISSVLLEGGASLIGTFVKETFPDLLHLFIAPKILGGGIAGLKFKDPFKLSKHIPLHADSIETLGPDIYIQSHFMQRGR